MTDEPNEQRERLVQSVIERGNRPLEVALLKMADALAPLSLEKASRVLGGIIAGHISMHELEERPEAFNRLLVHMISAGVVLDRAAEAEAGGNDG